MKKLIWERGFKQVVDMTPQEIELRAAQAEKPADLSPAQFEWLLAFTGLGDLWDGIESDLKRKDRATFAAVRMQRKRSVYRLEVTLQEVARMRPVAAKIAPDVDLSDATISAAWKLAEAV